MKNVRLTILIIVVISLISLFAWYTYLYRPIIKAPDQIIPIGRINPIEAVTESNFEVTPTSIVTSKRESIEFIARIDNNADDQEDHKFRINVIPIAASYTICNPSDLDLCDSPNPDLSLFEYIDSWINQNESEKTIPINTESSFSFKVNIPDDAAKASYIFNVYACFDEEECDDKSDNLWSNAAPFAITITSDP